MVYFTRTVLPLAFPGIHLDIPLTTLIDSLSNDGYTLFATSTFEMLPSCSTTKLTNMRPSILFFVASIGYLTLYVRYLNSSSLPPGKLGCCSTT